MSIYTTGWCGHRHLHNKLLAAIGNNQEMHWIWLTSWCFGRNISVCINKGRFQWFSFLLQQTNIKCRKIEPFKSLLKQPLSIPEPMSTHTDYYFHYVQSISIMYNITWNWYNNSTISQVIPSFSCGSMQVCLPLYIPQYSKSYHVKSIEVQ